MISKFSKILLLLITPIFCNAQIISGKIIDKKTFEPLIGVLVKVDSVNSGAVTDIDGKFILNIKKFPIKIRFSYIGYKKNELILNSYQNQITVELEKNNLEIKEVVVQSEYKKASDNTLLIKQKNSAFVSDGISIETIKKNPDRNASDVLRRISGSTIQDGKYAIIRGLPDRYNSAFLNGSPLPSSEPDRRAFAFDIFPSNLLDNITIFKTSTPEQNSEFAGGNIQIKTIDIPEKKYLNVSISTSYNDITTFNNFYKNINASLDFLGIDDGTRKLQENFPSSKELNRIQSNLSDPNRINNLTGLSKTLQNNFQLNRIESVRPATSFQISFGDNYKFNKFELGSVFAFSHTSTPNFQEINRFDYDDSKNKLFQFNDRQYTINTLMGSIWNIGLKYGRNSKFSLKNLFNVNSSDQTIIRNGQDLLNGSDIKSYAFWYTQNTLLSSQLQGDHVFEKYNFKIEYGTGISYLNRIVPDLRRLRYQKITGDPTQEYSVPISSNAQPDIAGRFYSNQNDLTSSFFGNIEKNYKSIKTIIKLGFYLQDKTRDFNARQIGYISGGIFIDPSLYYLSIDKIFTNNNFGKNGFLINEATTPSDSYKAGSFLLANYIQLESKIKKNLRLVYGIRYESFRQDLNTFKPGIQKVFDTSFVVNDFLPSVNIIYSITDKSNLRISYSKTLSRPEFRELAPFQFFDFNDFLLVEGSTTIRRSVINNFDIRYEWYFKPGQYITTTFFYKHFTDPIEKYLIPNGSLRLMSYLNVDRATSTGLEIDFKVSLASILNSNRRILESLYFINNLSFINSQVDTRSLLGSGSDTRPMQGQSNYLVNSGIQYDNSKLNISLTWNKVGRRITSVGNLEYQEIWENPRDIIDFQLSRKWKNFEAKFSIRDLLKQNIIFYQDLNRNGNLDESDNIINNFNVGSVYSISLSFNI